MSKEQLEQSLNNWQAKLAEYEYELSITANPEAQLKLRHQIEECHEHIKMLQRQIETLLTPEPANFPTTDVVPEVETVELRSEVGIDYNNLKQLLSQGKWEEADQETDRVMLVAVNREQEGWLDVKSIETFPSVDLRTINQLWIHYSNRRFGLSVQKQIYLETGNKLGDYNEKTWERFGNAVGWKKGGRWLLYKEMTYSISAPVGHLPGLWVGGLWSATLLSRTDL